MEDRRKPLPVGTRIRLEQGSLYEITGEPMGCGGGSILYPAQRLIRRDGVLEPDGVACALKECFPVSADHLFVRSCRGGVISQSGAAEAEAYLQRAQQLQLREGEISQKIFRTASRMLPIREASRHIHIALPGGEPAEVENTVTVMDSLTRKGRSLTACIREKRRFSAAETFRVIQQLLFALREVHQAGFLHLDIQDGNVFLRGALEDKSELLTLIDFGAARPMTDGKTAPIADRVIFTSHGFSAPEMLLRNDGTLRLGPEADIYSVGCLALFLLTGQRANQQLLLANRTGNYLKPNQLRRISCPGHLVDRLQRILAKALEKSPENRYQNADDMLEEVSVLVEALQPYRTELSAVQYDAFVCYRHGDVDSAAVLTLQRELEHYRAPRGVGKSRKPFGRVFVDEGELSSCADFGQQIREALKNARWLIVICSADTPASPWVQLEIETFLQYHDRSRILAVLTGGEPRTAFPERLLGSSSGEGEVLAADARGSDLRQVLRRLQGDALLKVAAPMLNTTFDALKQRHKVYRLQRIAAVTAAFLLAAMGFAAYAVNRAQVIQTQAVRIEEEYRNALVNESRFLAEQAAKRLEDNDPLGAIELALAALPAEGRDRPVLPEAEYILGEALGIYMTPGDARNTASPTGMLETADESFILDETGEYLLSWGRSESGVRIWDARTLSLVQTLAPTGRFGYIRDLFLTSRPGELVYAAYDRVLGMDYLSGEVKWEAETPDGLDAAISGDGKWVLLLSKGASGGQYGVDILSSETGELLSHVEFTLPDGRAANQVACVSPDLKWVAIVGLDADYSMSNLQSEHLLFLLDLETGACTLLLDERSSFDGAAFVQQGLAVIHSRGYTMQTRHGNADYWYVDPATVWLELYATDAKTLLWREELTSHSTSQSVSRIRDVAYDTGEKSGTGILFTFNDRCVLLDAGTGEKLRDYTLFSGAMDIQYRENGFRSINADGSVTIVGYGSDTALTIPLLNTPVTAVEEADGLLYVQSNPVFSSDYTIRKFQLDKYDGSFTAHHTTDESLWQVFGYRCSGNETNVVLARENEICLVQTQSGQMLRHKLPEEYGFSYYTLDSLSEDGLTAYFSGPLEAGDENWIGNRQSFRVDLLTGSVTPLTQPKEPEPWPSVIECTQWGSRVLFSLWHSGEGNDQKIIYVWDRRTNALTEQNRIPLEALEGEGVRGLETDMPNSLQVDEENELVYLATCRSMTYTPVKLVRMDVRSGELQQIPLSFTPEAGEDALLPWHEGCHRWNREGTLAVFGYDSWVYGVDAQGEELWRIPVETKISAIRFLPDEASFLLISEDRVITQHSAADGSCIQTIALEDFSENVFSCYPEDIRWLALKDGTQAVIVNENCFLLSQFEGIVQIVAVVEDCFGYDAATDRFLIAEDSNGFTIGSFRRYTLEDLIEKGNSLVSPEA